MTSTDSAYTFAWFPALNHADVFQASKCLSNKSYKIIVSNLVTDDSATAIVGWAASVQWTTRVATQESPRTFSGSKCVAPRALQGWQRKIRVSIYLSQPELRNGVPKESKVSPITSGECKEYSRAINQRRCCSIHFRKRRVIHPLFQPRIK